MPLWIPLFHKDFDLPYLGDYKSWTICFFISTPVGELMNEPEIYPVWMTAEAELTVSHFPHHLVNWVGDLICLSDCKSWINCFFISHTSWWTDECGKNLPCLNDCINWIICFLLFYFYRLNFPNLVNFEKVQKIWHRVDDHRAKLQWHEWWNTWEELLNEVSVVILPWWN